MAQLECSEGCVSCGSQASELFRMSHGIQYIVQVVEHVIVVV